MEGTLTGTVHIWATYAILALTIIGLASEKIPTEIVSLLVLSGLLVLFEAFPISSPNGENPLDVGHLLAGFANPALIAVLALLIVGNGLWRSGALDWTLKLFLDQCGNHRRFAVGICFVTVFVASPFVNNTPVVVIFIPILEAIAQRFFVSPAKLMIPLSFIAILAGMTTLVGSSTNLLVSGTLSQLGRDPLGFFDFTVPGLVLASIGVLYVMLVAPFLLIGRESPARRLMAGRHRRFVAQFTVGHEAKLLKAQARFNLLGIRGMRLILVQRGEHPYLPPFDRLEIEVDDVLVVMATHDALAEAQTKFPRLMFSASGKEDLPINDKDRMAWLSRSQIVAEIMIAPGSQFSGQTLEEIGFRARYGCLVLGVERRSRVTRRLAGGALREGDVLVVQGDRAALDRIRQHRGVVVLDGTARPLPTAQTARTAGAIFTGTILVASTGFLPIAAAAVIGVALMLTTRVLTLNQAARAVDRQIFLMVGTSLALGAAMVETGAAAYLANGVIGLVGTSGPVATLSALFLLVALLTNVLSNNATAILFTPIALGLADALQADPMAFVLAVLFGANCSFATPIGYQTNLLVMGPGHYRFKDFMQAGGPLVLILWVAFSIFIPWYYGIL